MHARVAARLVKHFSSLIEHL